jgi:glucose-1-phosphate adenylyltransferase
VSDLQQRAKDVIVCILGGGRGTRLDPLTRQRAKPAVPFAGKYRLIDIPISNAIHSGMERLLVLTQYNSVSLHRHIVDTYKFDIFSRGFVQILAAQQTLNDEGWFQGTADAVRRNLAIVRDLRGDLVLILSGDHLYRMDYREMLRTHLEHSADITLAVLPCREDEIESFGAVRVDAAGRVVEFREKPKDAAARDGMAAASDVLSARGIDAGRPYLASMGIYLFRKEVLERCLDNTLSDFGHHILPRAADRLRVQAHFFDGYWRDIGTIRSFYDAHMDLIEPRTPLDFYDPTWPFFTHPRYLPGTRLTDCRFHRTILAGGGVVSESAIEHSVIGVRSEIRGATVRRSLIFGADSADPTSERQPRSGIRPGTVIENAIVDKNVSIGRDVRIVNEAGIEQGEGDYHVIREGIVIVPKNTVIPDGTVI